MSSRSESGAALKALARAIELQQNGRLDEAEAVYAKLIADNDNDPTTLINAGALALARSDPAGAIARLERAIAIVPNNPIAHANLGLALIHAGRDVDALARLDRAIELKGDFAQAHNSRGIALSRLTRRDEAMRAFERALALLPAYAEAAVNLGALANAAGEPGVARSAFARVLARDPSHVTARTGSAFADALDGRIDAALAELNTIVADQPGAVSAWGGLGAVNNWSWRHADAEAAWRRSLALALTNRDAQFGIASTLLARGHYAEGFTAFDASRAAPPASLAHLPAWTGEHLEGTLVVHGEQGFGDVVQFARFLPGLRERVGRVVVLLEDYWAPLAPLLRTLEGVDRVITASRDLDPSAARVSMLALPRIAGATPDRLPRPPYLAALPERREQWQKRLAGLPRPRVGLAWSVFARDDNAYVTRHKSIPASALAPLLDIEGITFVSLQPGAAGDPAVFGVRAQRIEPAGADIHDFGDTAALVAELDLVIAPDTAVAHVAGALARPVWLLERFHGCWRWRLEAETSPWYPTLRIFRQARFLDWSDSVARASAALARWRDANR